MLIRVVHEIYNRMTPCGACEKFTEIFKFELELRKTKLFRKKVFKVLSSSYFQYMIEK